ncbi:MAG: type IVB secretion system apparatus protein IcmL/DotI [Alphaproteobacteria bacterium]|nr:type IVB secretion system apparatus protein IcmL/DotI [Alphaproteobacteria bacterium]
MVDIDDEQDGLELGGDAGETVGVADVPYEDTAAAAATSPLIKFIEALTGKKKTPPTNEASVTAPVPEAPAGVAPVMPAETGGSGRLPDVPMPCGPLETIVVRNEFYRDGFRNLLLIAIAEAVVIAAILVAFIYHMATAVSEDRYFATTADGRIMQLVPLDQPNMTTAAMMSWVSQAASEIMTFSYHDYQRRLQQSSRHFTRRGWETFTDALNRAKIVEGVRESKQVVSCSPRAAPTILSQGVSAGKYRWIVQLPLQVSYSGRMQRTDNLKVTLVIERVPSLENPNGVGIEQWIAVAE